MAVATAPTTNPSGKPDSARDIRQSRRRLARRRHQRISRWLVAIALLDRALAEHIDSGL